MVLCGEFFTFVFPDEPAVSPPDFHNQLHYMQEEHPYPTHLGEGEVVYASGYSEGKMSPQVEAKVTSPKQPVGRHGKSGASAGRLRRTTQTLRHLAEGDLRTNVRS